MRNPISVASHLAPPMGLNSFSQGSSCQLFRMRVPHRVEAAACRSGSHMVRNHQCCTATANCLFAPCLSIYTLVALVRLYRPECNHLSVEYAFSIVTNQNLTIPWHNSW